jgi:uncharacterized membrane protein (UPF0127 family)
LVTELKVFTVKNTERATVLATKGTLASSYWARFWGLMFKRGVADGSGILLTKSASIHSFFMFFRFDAIFLDEQGTVMKVVPAMRPWRIAFGGRGAKNTLELPAGVAERTRTVAGDTLIFEEPAVAVATGT